MWHFLRCLHSTGRKDQKRLLGAATAHVTSLADGRAFVELKEDAVMLGYAWLDQPEMLISFNQSRVRSLTKDCYLC